ncbi:MAG: hypothetical protein D3915_16020 [Candidatus Electrothrix sp. AU1_5]|nr:hypothetical protein [Candidatus Electrothrix gigas]
MRYFHIEKKLRSESLLVKLLADGNVQRVALKTLDKLKSVAVAPILSRYLKNTGLRDTAAKTLISMNVSFPELQKWQEEQLKAVQEKIKKNDKQEAATALGSVFTEKSVTLLSSLLTDANQDVVQKTIESFGSIGEYHPGLVQAQAGQLLNLTAHANFNLRRAAIAALGQIISFSGKEQSTDLPKLEKKVHPALHNLLFDSQQDLANRLAALDALGATGRLDYAKEIYDFLNTLEKDKDESLRYRSFLWLGRMVYTPAYDYIENELEKLAKGKAAWRKERDSEQEKVTSGKLEKKDKTWKKEHWEYMLGNALARIKPETTGIQLLNHPLYQVRQGAIRALASRIADGDYDAALIGKIIQAHQNFDPDDLPSPFPYAAFQAIDLALWNLEYTGKKDDVTTLKKIHKNLQPCQIPGQEGAIKERLEWTIERLAENLAFAKNAKMSTK